MIDPSTAPDTAVPGVPGGRREVQTATRYPVETDADRPAHSPVQDVTAEDDEPEFTVVIPAYNEEASIRGTVETLVDVTENIAASVEIVVVDDGSDDDTRTTLRTLAVEFPVVGAVLNDENSGKGHAIRSGCRAADGRYILLLDADGDIDPAQVVAFLERASSDEADVVVGSKRHPDSDVSYPLRRRVLSKGYAVLVGQLLGLEVSDTQVGMKLIRAEVAEAVMPLLLVEGYAFDVELLALARRRGFTVREAPVDLDFAGDSEVDWPTVGRMTRDTLRVCCRLQLLGSYEAIDRAVSYVRESEEPVDSGRGAD